MRDLIVFAASWLLYLMAAVFVAFWIVRETRRDKVRVVVAVAIGLAVVAILILVAGHLHTDPRPFVQNPRMHPLIPHGPDNGFPSDHSSGAGLIAALALWRQRIIGALLSLAAIGVAAGRVAAHVHHVQDVAAGLGIGIVGAAVGIAVAASAMTAVGRRVSVGQAR